MKHYVLRIWFNLPGRRTTLKSVCMFADTTFTLKKGEEKKAQEDVLPSVGKIHGSISQKMPNP